MWLFRYDRKQGDGKRPLEAWGKTDFCNLSSEMAALQLAAVCWSSKEDKADLYKWTATTPEKGKATCCVFVWAEMFLLGERKKQRTALCRRSSRKVNHNLPWAPWKLATVMPMLIARIRYRLCCEITPFLLSKTTPQKLTWILYLAPHCHSLYSALKNIHPNP